MTAPGAPDPDGSCPTPGPASGNALGDACRPALPGESVADCVLCGEPTEYAADTPGLPRCPRCAWQQAQRGACSG